MPDSHLLDRFTSIDNLLARNAQALNEIKSLITPGSPTPVLPQDFQKGIVDVREFDLTSSRSEELVVYPAAQYIQVFSDGILEGISIKLGDQSAISIDCNKFDFIDAYNNRLHLSNDVKVGRNSLTLVFSDIPFGRHFGSGQGGITLSELAVRNGGFSTYDRRGEVIWHDDFEDNANKWTFTSAGVGAAFALSTDYVRRGNSSGKLTTGNVIGNTSRATRYEPYNLSNKIGFEVSSSMNDNANFQIDIRGMKTAVLYFMAQVRYVPATDKLEYYDSAANWVELASGIDFSALPDMFHPVKLVIDIDTFMYTRFMIDDLVYDMSNLPIYTTGGAATKYLSFTVDVETAINNNISFYLDEAIITKNEE